MVFANICEHASSAFIFASTSSDQISLASSDHFRKIQMASSEHFVNLDLSFIEKKSFAPSNLVDTVQPISAAYNQLCVLGCQITSGSFV